jgi:hypothetical protein
MTSILALFPQGTQDETTSGTIDPAEGAFSLIGHSGEVFSCDFTPDGMLRR